MHHNSKKISLFATVLILLSLVAASAASMAPTIARAQEENSTNATSTNATTTTSTNQTTGPTNNATNATTPTTTPTTNATTNATTTTTTNATKPVCTCSNNTNQTAPPAVIVVPPAGNATGGNVTIPSTTPTNETHLKTMLLTAVPDRSTIDRGSTQRITITATDENGTGIPGANVTTLTLNYASGANKTLAAGSTDQNGQFVTTAKIGGNSKPGQFNIIASAKHDGYADAKAVSGFVVTKKGK